MVFGKQDRILTTFGRNETKMLDGEEVTLEQYVERTRKELGKKGLRPQSPDEGGYLVEQRPYHGKTQVVIVYDEPVPDSIMEANKQRNRKNKK
jgi:hypothetical protein